MWGRYPICIMDNDASRAEQLRVILAFLGEQCKIITPENWEEAAGGDRCHSETSLNVAVEEQHLVGQPDEGDASGDGAEAVAELGAESDRRRLEGVSHDRALQREGCS